MKKFSAYLVKELRGITKKNDKNFQSNLTQYKPHQNIKIGVKTLEVNKGGKSTKSEIKSKEGKKTNEGITNESKRMNKKEKE